jgi:hypothetical protein
LFIDDPKRTRFILDKLVDDPSETVRRSVANHLNDVSKDHPDVALEIASSWLKKPSRNRERSVRHALRTLIKKGDPKVMALFGYGPARVKASLKVKPARLKIGETAKIELEIRSTVAKDQKLLIDYAVHDRKANGSLSPKVFKWTEKVLPGRGTLNLTKQQPFRDVSTRKHNPGMHQIEVMINGQPVARKGLRLDAP